MDNRSSLGPKNHALPPQRAVSGSYALQQQSLRRTALPSRLNNVRSASQPGVPAAHAASASSSASAAPLLGSAADDARTTHALMGSQEKYCRSPEVIDLDGESDHGAEDGDIDPRPTKKARTDGEHVRLGGGEVADSSTPTPSSSLVVDLTADAAHTVVPGSPLPSLPKQRAPAQKSTLSRDSRSRHDQAARKAHGLEPPAMATRLPSPKNIADFSPWTGHHPEDVLNETVIKSGYFDKAPTPNTVEYQSAKHTIWPNLSQKNNMGLQTLSYLFTSVLEKRLAMGKCTAPSTFKPPPRVTVTDTKREAWLRDLANSEIPLRKQSRTIPHGIRGKLLMEQCLTKGISMPRAVWLAKCVGANELRAFRRKGVSGAAAASGESKWIREWTIHVEQFVEGVIALCGQPEWQTKMDYAVKLATSFYSEQLLERDHYLDWIVSSFAHSTMESLPIWIILVQLYWKDIVAFAKRGRRLAEATLDFLHRISSDASNAAHPLKIRLRKLVVVLAVFNRGCLILPQTWTKYKYLLSPSAAPTANLSPNLEPPAQNLAKRNARLTDPLSKTPEQTRCALLRLYSDLDAVSTCVDIDKMVAAALAVITDPSALVHALLDWAASLYRTGFYRIYLAARQIVRLRENGRNTDDAILDYLQNKGSAAIDFENAHMVVAELIRVNAFSPSRYMQWLITSGALSGGKGATLATGLLSVLPIDSLPPHLHNTRQTLMRRLTQFNNEEQVMRKLHKDIAGAMVDIDSFFEKCMNQMNLLSCSARFTITRRLSYMSKAWAKEQTFSVQMFCQIRTMTEASKDIFALSHLVEAALLTSNMILLASAIDTVNMYAECFAALERLPTLAELATERYRLLRSQQSLDRTLILGLKSLLARVSSKSNLLSILENDLTICDQETSMAVCSPASDNLVSMHASTLDSDNDIDAVFASGNTMDEQLMQRVFSRIVQRADKSDGPSAHAPSKLCAWWSQLRAVDVSGFEQLVRKYFQSGLTDGNEARTFTRVACTLIASTCVAFNTIIQTAKEAQTSHAASVALTMLLSPSCTDTGLHISENFRFRLAQQRCQSESTDQVAYLLSTAMDSPDLLHPLAAVTDLISSYLANGHQQALKSMIEVEKPSVLHLRNCSQLMAGMLQLNERGDAGREELNARTVVKLADPLSVKHCALALQYLSKAVTSATSENGELQSAILDAVAGGNQVWPQLLEGAGPGIMAAIYHWSRDKVLASALNERAEDASFDDPDVHRQLDVLDITHYASKGEDNSQIVAALTEKLKALDGEISSYGTENGAVPPSHPLMQSLDLLLHLSILYSTSTEPTTEMFKQFQGQMLAALCTLLIQPYLQRHLRTLEYIYDIAGVLSDALPDSILNNLRKTFPGAGKDHRITSLLGDTASPDAWLALVSHLPPPGSQQQRLLMKQSSNSQTLPPPPSTTTMATQQQQSIVPGRQPHASTPKLAAATRPSANPATGASDAATKTVPFALRRWEILSDATPTVGENDTSLSLGLFGARKV